MNKSPTNLGYNSNKIILKESNTQIVQDIIMTAKKIPKKEYFIPTKDIPSYSTTLLYTPKVSTYSTQQVSNYLLKKCQIIQLNKCLTI